MRRDSTPAERRLWQRIRAKSLGSKLKRQIPFGPYTLDFAFVAARLVIEIDGDTHATAAAGRADAVRDALLLAHGLRVLRFSNREVFGTIDGVLATIVSALG